MDRWAIVATQVPLEIVSPDVWELYRWRIVGISAVLLIQTLLIVLLLRNIANRKRAQASFTRKQIELEETQRLERVGNRSCCVDISDMKQANATVTEFSGRLILAGEEERGRIARELHDDINQRLALLANGLQEAEQAASANMDPLQKKALQQLWQATNEIGSSIQEICHQLHPSKLHYLGLATTLRHLCKEVAQQHKIQIDCIVSVLPANLDENVSLNLFRIVQESLRNVVKHSHAHHVKVELNCQCEGLRLLVSDDGVGFDNARGYVGSLGLISMRERLRCIGGEFSVWSMPSLGTRVEAIVPDAMPIHTRAGEAVTD